MRNHLQIGVNRRRENELFCCEGERKTDQDVALLGQDKRNPKRGEILRKKLKSQNEN